MVSKLDLEDQLGLGFGGFEGLRYELLSLEEDLAVHVSSHEQGSRVVDVFVHHEAHPLVVED